MNINFLRFTGVTLAVFSTNTFALTVSDIQEMKDVVKEMCETPTYKGQKFEINSSLDLGVIIRMVKANLAGFVGYSTWEGIEQVRETQKDRVKCVEIITKTIAPLMQQVETKPAPPKVPTPITQTEKCLDTLSTDPFVRMKLVTPPVFDWKWYSNEHEDLQKAFSGDPVKLTEHWVCSGINEGRRGSRLFDVAFYLNNNNDLIDAFGKGIYKRAVVHWIEFGAMEGRSGHK